MARRQLSRSLGLACSLLALPGCAALGGRLQDIRPGSLLGAFSRPPAAEVAVGRPSDLIPPEALRVTATEDRQISLAWNPVLVGDVSGYVITRARAAQGPFSMVGRIDSRFGTLFTDEGDGPGALGDAETYFYRIHPIDSEGRMSRSHAYVSATTQGAPGMPRGLRVYSNLPRRAVLSWEPSEHWTVSDYAAYRAPTMAGPWQKIGTISGRLHALHEDQVPGDLRVMYYRITALNRFGGESEMTEPVRAVTKAEPLPPIDLSVADLDLGQVHLRWAPNVESDLTAYEIWRARREDDSWGEPERLGQVPAPETAFTDPGVGCGEQLRYQLRALDADGLISDFSSAMEVRARDLDLAIERLPDGRRRVRWDAALARAWPGARISQPRRVLPERVLGTSSGADHFDLPEEVGDDVRLRVTLLSEPPEDDSRASTAAEAPYCEILVRALPEPLLNTPAASVD